MTANSYDRPGTNHQGYVQISPLLFIPASAGVRLLRKEINPLLFISHRQIERRSAFIVEYWSHQQTVAKHILLVQICYISVSRIFQYHGAHGRDSGPACLQRCFKDIWHKRGLQACKEPYHVNRFFIIQPGNPVGA